MTSLMQTLLMLTTLLYFVRLCDAEKLNDTISVTRHNAALSWLLSAMFGLALWRLTA